MKIGKHTATALLGSSAIVISQATNAHAMVGGATGSPLLDGIILTVVFGALGLALMILSFYVIDKITPGNLGRELVEQKNVALAILVGAMVLGVSIIIAAAIAG